MTRIVGIGIDVADIARITRLSDDRGAHFTAKWFAPSEIAECGGDARRLAERFAVKEAVWKALGPSSWSGPLPWRTIVTERAGTGMRVHVASARHLHISASVSSTDRVAIATAVASDAGQSSISSTDSTSTGAA